MIYWLLKIDNKFKPTLKKKKLIFAQDKDTFILQDE